MNICTYDPDHSAVATHYYLTEGGSKRDLCYDCAYRFGYPQYLAEYPRPWAPEHGYVTAYLNGEGAEGVLPGAWTMTDGQTEFWLEILGCQDIDGLMADAIWDPYRAHQVVDGSWTYEVTRVTVLPVVCV